MCYCYITFLIFIIPFDVSASGWQQGRMHMKIKGNIKISIKEDNVSITSSQKIKTPTLSDVLIFNYALANTSSNCTVSSFSVSKATECGFSISKSANVTTVVPDKSSCPF